MIAHWFWLFTGARNEGGDIYGLWSGFGGAVPDFLILGGFVTFLRRHNCHQHRCWRLGRHTVDGSPWCNHHHQAARDRVQP